MTLSTSSPSEPSFFHSSFSAGLRTFFLALTLTILAAMLISSPARAEDSTDLDPAGFSTDTGILCLPDSFAEYAGGCSQAGPGAYQANLAEHGITLPLPPKPGNKPDFGLTYTDVSYGLVRTERAPVYGSLEDAQDNNKRNAIRRVEAPFSYISYTDETVIDGKRYYMVAPGEWMTAVDIVRIGLVPLFQGLTFKNTPAQAFGWVLTYLSPGALETKRTPGNEHNDYTGHVLNNHEIVWIFDEVQVGEEAWYMVGPDEWVHQNMIARVIPNTTPPEGVTGDRWIEVNLFEQTISVYENRQLVFATLIASGLDPFWTRPGLFQIYDKLDSTPMRGSFEADRSDAYYLEDVPWTMYFDQARALHGAYWRANLGFPQSHGCVNLSVGDSHWLYEWANEGDWVYVWDPSGQTPIEEDLYTAGGA